jgi:hypothetical protein
VADGRQSSTTGEPTSPFLPTFDTGGFATSAPAAPEPARPEATLTLERDDDEPLAYQALETETSNHPVVVPPAQPLVVPGSYQFVKRWVFVLIVAAVWLVAVPAGAALYYWWVGDLDPDKTWPVYGTLLYLIATTVVALLVAMVQNRPKVSALAIALMSAPLASTAGAAALYGAYVFGWIAR